MFAKKNGPQIDTYAHGSEHSEQGPPISLFAKLGKAAWHRRTLRFSPFVGNLAWASLSRRAPLTAARWDRAAGNLGYPDAEMPVMISLLRGVNVGGHKVKMDALRELYTSLGLRQVETFIQSGNVVFATDALDLVRLTKRIEAAIEKTFGFECPWCSEPPRR